MSTPDVAKYQDPRSVLVVGPAGNLRQLHCPFRVQCIERQEHIPAGAFVFAESVFLHKKHTLLYWINQRLYPYHHFRIVLAY